MSVKITSCGPLSEETCLVQAFVNLMRGTRHPLDDLTENLRIILSKVADFVSKTLFYTYTRFIQLGVLTIGSLWILSPVILQKWLTISKTRFNQVLHACLSDPVNPLPADLEPHLGSRSSL
jgi:hypothetical protein